MKFDPSQRHRRSIRLKGYDYTQPGAYFVTLVTADRACLFGEILEGEIWPNPIGKIVEKCWYDLERHFPTISLDEFILMPNHLHGIICMGEASASLKRNFQPVFAADASPQRPIGTAPGSLGAIIQNFKSVSTRKINQVLGNSGQKVWQRNYYERIIRDEAELNRIRQYILNNPIRCELDNEYPHRS
jgi:REP element-mobilizing transposase RayT